MIIRGKKMGLIKLQIWYNVMMNLIDEVQKPEVKCIVFATSVLHLNMIYF